MKGLEVFSAALIAELQSSEIAKPTERAFDDVACLTEPAAVRMRLAKGSQERFGSQPFHECRQGGRAVTGVALQDFGFGARASSRSSDGRYAEEKWECHLIIT